MDTDEEEEPFQVQRSSAGLNFNKQFTKLGGRTYPGAACFTIHQLNDGAFEEHALLTAHAAGSCRAQQPLAVGSEWAGCRSASACQSSSSTLQPTSAGCSGKLPQRISDTTSKSSSSFTRYSSMFSHHVSPPGSPSSGTALYSSADLARSSPPVLYRNGIGCSADLARSSPPTTPARSLVRSRSSSQRRRSSVMSLQRSLEGEMGTIADATRQAAAAATAAHASPRLQRALARSLRYTHGPVSSSSFDFANPMQPHGHDESMYEPATCPHSLPDLTVRSNSCQTSPFASAANILPAPMLGTVPGCKPCEDGQPCRRLSAARHTSLHAPALAEHLLPHVP